MNSAGGGTGICSWRLQQSLQYPSSSCTEIAGWKVIWAKPYIRSWVRWAPTQTPCLVQVNSSKYFGVENYLHCPSIFKRPYIFCRKRSTIHRRVESHLLWGCRIDKIAGHILSRWIGPPTQPRLLQGSCCHDGGIRYEVGSAQISIDSWSTAPILYGPGVTVWCDRVMWLCERHPRHCCWLVTILSSFYTTHPHNAAPVIKISQSSFGIQNP